MYKARNERFADLKPRRQLIETTVGRAIFNMILPAEIRYVNEVLDKGKLNDLVAHCYQWLGNEQTTELVDEIKDIGFKYATRSGASIAVSDITVPEAKYKIVADTEAKISEVERQYRRGLLTEEEQYNRMIELWQQATSQVADAVRKNLAPEANLSVMAMSGATKGGFSPIAQLAGMRGLMADPSGASFRCPSDRTSAKA